MNDITIITGNNPFVVTMLASLIGTFLAICLFCVLRFILKMLKTSKAKNDEAKSDAPAKSDEKKEDKDEAQKPAADDADRVDGVEKSEEKSEEKTEDKAEAKFDKPVDGKDEQK